MFNNEKKTTFGLGTPFGLKTPFKLPNANKLIIDILNDLAKQLYPTGRAWGLKLNSVFFNLHKAFNLSFLRLIEDSNSTIDSQFPDNINFDENDCLLWENRLGLISNLMLDIEIRKTAIKRKMAFPGNIKARQHPFYIEYQLRLAGFDVYIHENRFFEFGEWVYKTPQEISMLPLVELQHGLDTQHGSGTQHGGGAFNLIANNISNSENYNVGPNNLWATFFIGGENLGDYTNVPNTRLREFKELVLKLKPAHTVAFTFINYT